MEKKILIATYSWSGYTKRLANQIAKLLPGADQYQIAVPAGTYDLTDMYATSDRAKNQLATGELPPLANPIPELDQYDLILVGSPVWSGQPVVPVKQFLNQLTNFAGYLAPFYTDAGVAGDFEATFKEWAPQVTVLPGQEGSTQLQDWVKAVTSN